MTETEQRIAIAKACGLTIVSDGITDHLTPCGKKTERDPEGCLLKECPNYLNDLNVMREVEAKHLTSSEGGDYDLWLWVVLKRDWEKEGNNLAPIACWHASAAQKCEAFLHVKGLWKRPK